jgi:hypothetical protein
MREKKNKKKFKKPFKRKIHLMGQEWSYRVTGNAILVLDPKGAKLWKRILNFDKLADENRHENYCDCMSCETGTGACLQIAITPARVKKFIEKVCVPEMA